MSECDRYLDCCVGVLGPDHGQGGKNSSPIPKFLLSKVELFLMALVSAELLSLRLLGSFVCYGAATDGHDDDRHMRMMIILIMMMMIGMMMMMMIGKMGVMMIQMLLL